jgi:hypothetical protein
MEGREGTGAETSTCPAALRGNAVDPRGPPGVGYGDNVSASLTVSRSRRGYPGAVAGRGAGATGQAVAPGRSEGLGSCPSAHIAAMPARGKPNAPS